MLKVGNTISFIYNKGSNPGSWRTVKIEDVTNSHVSGIDLDVNKYRKFDRMFMQNTKLGQVAGFEAERQAVEHLVKAFGYSNTIDTFNKKWNVDYWFKDGVFKEKSLVYVGTSSLQDKVLTVRVKGHTLKIHFSGSPSIELDGINQSLYQALNAL